MFIKSKEKIKDKFNEGKLKDRLEFLQQSLFINTENPIQKLKFKKAGNLNTKSNLLLSIVVVLLLSTSIIFGSFFKKKCDPILISAFNNFSGSISDRINKPYVVTIEEFNTFDHAKKEAIELLPRLKQINIKSLNNKIYTFEIERLGSKKKAYEIANSLIKNGYKAVHVRYLKD